MSKMHITNHTALALPQVVVIFVLASRITLYPYYGDEREPASGQLILDALPPVLTCPPPPFRYKQ
ncbi:hypothetical protein OH76DRAFT_1408842 [Lentinus brumalis]|uniref:Uncharacterized protein n=1 Tax=Lentinus brumalis TaxID=2498619 RepID=A0A371CWG5_9APHY|nr:hypothetical protein OH76DRAFT_1408842 [Polyporus brumalis]